MISDFQLLSEKISRLAALAQSLREDNAELRRTVASLEAENADLTTRVMQAHERVSLLLDTIPANEPDEEVA